MLRVPSAQLLPLDERPRTIQEDVMPIASRLKWYLDSRSLDYELVHHSHTKTSRDSAAAAHLRSGRVAKGVLLEDERGYLLAILPASCRLSLQAIEDQLHRRLELASERELGDLFPDCEVGAVPPAGEVYNLPMLVDDSLLKLPDLYLEAGDHEDLVHLSGESFRSLLSESPHAHFARPN